MTIHQKGNKNLCRDYGMRMTQFPYFENAEAVKGHCIFKTKTEENKMAETKKKNAPVETIRSGCVKVTIWANEYKDEKTGKMNEVFSVNLIKSYKDKDEWKETSSLKQNDLPKAILCMQKAFEYLALKKSVTEDD